jgi:hypothetical protein
MDTLHLVAIMAVHHEILNGMYIVFTCLYSGTSTYEFNSFRNLARMSNCSYLKAIFPIEIN